MARAGMSMAASTQLVFIDGGSLRHIEEVLTHHLVPFAPFIGADFILMKDNVSINY